MNAQVIEAVDEARTDSRWDGLSKKSPVGVDACRVVENECILEGDNVAFHALDLSHMRDAASSVPQPGNLDDEVHGGRYLLADCPQWQVHACHEHQGFEACNGVARRV